MNHIFLFSIVSVFFIFIFFYYLIEKNKIKKTKHFEITKLKYKPYHVWMYWENKPNSTKPDYLKLCLDTIKKHCSKNFEIHLINPQNLTKYLPNIRKDINMLRIPQKADYIRLALLYKYGGIWIDADTIVFSDLSEYIEKLQKYDFVGFGCHHHYCINNPLGFPKPANWVMVSRKNGILMKKCLDEANKIIDSKINSMYLPINYHIIGRKLLWSNIDELLKTSNWTYLHESSKCIDRDSNGEKFTNKRAISMEKFDLKCLNRVRFVPGYFTAPGFPQWFADMNKEKILESPMLISQMFRVALEKK